MSVVAGVINSRSRFHTNSSDRLPRLSSSSMPHLALYLQSPLLVAKILPLPPPLLPPVIVVVVRRSLMPCGNKFRTLSMSNPPLGVLYPVSLMYELHPSRSRKRARYDARSFSLATTSQRVVIVGNVAAAMAVAATMPSSRLGRNSTRAVLHIPTPMSRPTKPDPG
jgi:hypothetical protein